MFDKRAESLANRYGILDRMEILEHDLMDIPHIVHVEFDISDYPECNQVIMIPKYDIKPQPPYGVPEWDSWSDARHKQIEMILNVCKNHDLYNSGDRIEDYGEHWYIVRSCGKTWKEVQ